MEHSTGAVNWQPHNLAKAPGADDCATRCTHVARGADARLLLPVARLAAGLGEVPLRAAAARRHRLRAVARGRSSSARILDRLGEVAGTARRRRRRPALQLGGVVGRRRREPPDARRSRYLDQVHALYGALRELGRDRRRRARPAPTSTGYRLVVVPGLHLVRDARGRDARRRTSRPAAHALVTFYSGIVDENDRVRLGGYPGAFRDLLGVRVEEFAPLLPGAGRRRSSRRHGRVALDRAARARRTPRSSTASPTARRRACPRSPATRHDGAGDAWYLGDRCSTPASLRDARRPRARGGRRRRARPGARGRTSRSCAASAATAATASSSTTATDDVDCSPPAGATWSPANRRRRTVRVPAGAVRVIREEPTS